MAVQSQNSSRRGNELAVPRIKSLGASAAMTTGEGAARLKLPRGSPDTISSVCAAAAKRTQAESTGASSSLPMDTPNLLGVPDLPVRTFGPAHTAHALSPNLSAERIGVQPPRVGHDPPCGFLTAGGILSRLDRRLPLCVSDAWRENERPPENSLDNPPHCLLRL